MQGSRAVILESSINIWLYVLDCCLLKAMKNENLLLLFLLLQDHNSVASNNSGSDSGINVLNSILLHPAIITIIRKVIINIDKMVKIWLFCFQEFLDKI